MKYSLCDGWIVTAHQWFRNGDHPDDKCRIVSNGTSHPFLSEGKVVRLFRDPNTPGDSTCDRCNRLIHDHGFLETLSEMVCPGDFVVEGRFRISEEDWNSVARQVER